MVRVFLLRGTYRNLDDHIGDGNGFFNKYTSSIATCTSTQPIVPLISVPHEIFSLLSLPDLWATPQKP